MIIIVNMALSSLLRARQVSKFIKSHLSVSAACSARKKREPTFPKLEPKDDMSAKGRLRQKVFFSFYDYLKDYNSRIRDVIPAKAVDTYRLFKSGTGLLFKDMWAFSEVYDLLSSTNDLEKACRTLSYKQLELYLSLPNDLYVVIPTLTMCALPVVGYGAIALAMAFPKYLLSSHFWTQEVKQEIRSAELKDRHMHYEQLLRELPRYARKMRNKPYYNECKAIFKGLSHGDYHPTAGEVLAIRRLFTKGAVFHLSNLHHSHVRHLMKIHGLSYLVRWRFKLAQYGNLLLQIDRALAREGGPRSLSDLELNKACFRRGLNSTDLSREDMEEYLCKWLEVSSVLDHKSASLLLHLPVLLGYNKTTRFRKPKSWFGFGKGEELR